MEGFTTSLRLKAELLSEIGTELLIFTVIVAGIYLRNTLLSSISGAAERLSDAGLSRTAQGKQL